VRSQLDVFLTQYAQANNESESYKDAEQAVVTANEIANLLSKGGKDVLFSSIIEELERIGGQNVVITDISLSRTEEGIAPIAITGTAATRLALTTFQNDLESHERYTNVVLPLSSLARDRDIDFSITVTLSEQLYDDSIKYVCLCCGSSAGVCGV
jgi:hypothetical protein